MSKNTVTSKVESKTGSVDKVLRKDEVLRCCLELNKSNSLVEIKWITQLIRKMSPFRFDRRLSTSHFIVVPTASDIGRSTEIRGCHINGTASPDIWWPVNFCRVVRNPIPVTDSVGLENRSRKLNQYSPNIQFITYGRKNNWTHLNHPLLGQSPWCST